MAATGAVLAAALTVWQIRQRDDASENPLADARFLQLTDFDGIEQAAALSRDGRFVAFLSDRDGRMDVWVTQVGTGQFYNLTRDAARELVNPSVRTLGFSPDGTLVTFWARSPAGAESIEHRHLGGAGSRRTATTLPGWRRRIRLVQRRRSSRLPHARTW